MAAAPPLASVSAPLARLTRSGVPAPMLPPALSTARSAVRWVPLPLAVMAPAAVRLTVFEPVVRTSSTFMSPALVMLTLPLLPLTLPSVTPAVRLSST